MWFLYLGSDTRCMKNIYMHMALFSVWDWIDLSPGLWLSHSSYTWVQDGLISELVFSKCMIDFNMINDSFFVRKKFCLCEPSDV